MSPQNRGKQFEEVFRESCEKVEGLSIDRLHDQTNGFMGSSNICDFIVYKKPYEYYFECKSVHGNTLSIFSNDPKKKYGNITNKQWEGLLEKSEIEGVFAGIVCWWIDKDVTRFIPIKDLQNLRDTGLKSVRYDSKVVHRKYGKLGKERLLNIQEFDGLITIDGTKKRVFFDYDMLKFFEEAESREI